MTEIYLIVFDGVRGKFVGKSYPVISENGEAYMISRGIAGCPEFVNKDEVFTSYAEAETVSINLNEEKYNGKNVK